jgi:hypothetical protein
MLNNLLDPLSTFLNSSDTDLVSHACDIVANSIMAEISKEDPQGCAEYQDVVCHQIVVVFSVFVSSFWSWTL